MVALVLLQLKKHAMDNDDSPYKEQKKQIWSKFVQEVINTAKFNDEQLEPVNKVLSLCNDPSTTQLAVMKQFMPMLNKLFADRVLTPEEMNNMINTMSVLSYSEQTRRTNLF